MNASPIIFSAPMIRALLAATKTQTRRVVKPQPVSEGILSFGEAWKWMKSSKTWFSGVTREQLVSRPGLLRHCPYGQPGDLLWVRETCRAYERPSGEDGVHYFADDHWLVIDSTQEAADRWVDLNHYRTGSTGKRGQTVPPIHMPRWVSRLTLRITDIKAQRLLDMEGQHPIESDALAEGVNAIHHGDGQYYYSAFRDDPSPKNWSDPADAFRELWESINGADSWDSNPFVWAISFEVIKANVDTVIAQAMAA